MIYKTANLTNTWKARKCVVQVHLALSRSAINCRDTCKSCLQCFNAGFVFVDFHALNINFTSQNTWGASLGKKLPMIIRVSRS